MKYHKIGSIGMFGSIIELDRKPYSVAEETIHTL